MKRIFLFGILGFIIFSFGIGFIALNLQKAKAETVPAPVMTVAATVQASVTPTPVETSADPTDEPTIESPSPTASDTEEYDAEVDMTYYVAHKLPDDPDHWTAEESQWWGEAIVDFELDYEDIYKEEFGKGPSQNVLDVAFEFADATCTNFDDGYTLDDVATGIVDSGGSQKAQTALALAIRPGVLNLCPWNEFALN